MNVAKLGQVNLVLVAGFFVREDEVSINVFITFIADKVSVDEDILIKDGTIWSFKFRMIISFNIG